MSEREWKTFFRLLYKIVHMPVERVSTIREIVDKQAATPINQATLREFLHLYR